MYLAGNLRNFKVEKNIQPLLADEAPVPEFLAAASTADFDSVSRHGYVNGGEYFRLVFGEIWLAKSHNNQEAR